MSTSTPSNIAIPSIASMHVDDDARYFYWTAPDGVEYVVCLDLLGFEIYINDDDYTLVHRHEHGTLEMIAAKLSEAQSSD